MKPVILLALAVAAAASCKKAADPVAPPPAPVTVAAPVSRELVVYRDFPATLAALNKIEINARVFGVLEQATFTEGGPVEAGAPLFEIERAPYELAVAAAQADLERAEAAELLAEQRKTRFSGADGAISKLDVEEAVAGLAQATASVNQARAELENARLELGYTKIVAPVSGRMSRVLVDVGNLVGGSQPTHLATIVDDSQIYAYFDVPERALIAFYDRRGESETGVEHLDEKAVRLTLADGRTYEETGKIDFLDNQVDPGSRTAQARAVFPNPQGKLSPGLYGLVGFPAGPDPGDPTVTTALLVPSVAVLRDLGGDFVWVVDDSNTVRRTPVEAGASVEKTPDDPERPRERETVILRGLEGSERIIVAGLQRARDGAVVAPQPVEEPAS